jgi:hypothetical protein
MGLVSADRRVTLVVHGIRVAVDLPEEAVAVIEHAVEVKKRAVDRQRDRVFAAYVKANPLASANDAYRMFGGNRQEALRAFKRAKMRNTGAGLGGPPSRFPAPGNHKSDVEPSS